MHMFWNVCHNRLLQKTQSVCTPRRAINSWVVLASSSYWHRSILFTFPVSTLAYQAALTYRYIH